MPDYTIETSYHVPSYRHRTYSAETVAEACRLAIEDKDWEGEKVRYEDAGETFVSGIWHGSRAAYSGRPVPVPSQFGETTQRKAGHFEILHGLLKMLLADVRVGRASSARWIERASWAVVRAEAIIAGARDPDEPEGVKPDPGVLPETAPRPDLTDHRTSFRNQLSPVMQSAMAFEYYEVRPCIEQDEWFKSYTDETDYSAELVELQSRGEEFRTFWLLFGVDGEARIRIGDFATESAAHEVMNAILAVPAAARNAIGAEDATRSVGRHDIASVARRAADWLDDMINQSSNKQRI